MGLKQSSTFWERGAGDPDVSIKEASRRRIEGSGVSGQRTDNVLDMIGRSGDEFASPKIQALPKPLHCPCCGGDVFKPSLEIVIDVLGLPPQQAAILTAVWGARGYPCPTARIMDAIWADDPDGGPPHERARLYFKTQLSLLRKRLDGSGVGVETVDFRRGYRLVMGDV